MEGCVELLGEDPERLGPVDLEAVDQPEVHDPFGHDVVRQRRQPQLLAIGVRREPRQGPSADILGQVLEHDVGERGLHGLRLVEGPVEGAVLQVEVGVFPEPGLQGVDGRGLDGGEAGSASDNDGMSVNGWQCEYGTGERC